MANKNNIEIDLLKSSLSRINKERAIVVKALQEVEVYASSRYDYDGGKIIESNVHIAKIYGIVTDALREIEKIIL